MCIRDRFLTDIVKKYGADEPSISQDMDGVSRSDLVQIQDFIQNGDSNMAISLLKDISYKNPDHIGIKNNLAVMLFEAKRLDEDVYKRQLLYYAFELRPISCGYSTP